MTAARLGAIAPLALLLTLAACSGDAQPGPGQVDPAADETPAPMTCETIIRPSFSEELSSLGWTAKSEAFRIGAHELADGIQCVWGDYEHGTDIAQMYGWAPVEAEEAAELQQYLEDNGWLREDEGDYVYLTENPEMVHYLDEGEYGMTYQFADGWVALADTKQGLDLVTWRG
ncbi:hypothetical protein [Microbacterium karelineae]|uniref:hypothetical protein n=1 Tax=Microbacterium karelineae TaxID=2654283 RepID=UPI0012EA2FAE|nr:hypothetical protein [Microbacterium karelineae]